MFWPGYRIAKVVAYRSLVHEYVYDYSFSSIVLSYVSDNVCRSDTKISSLQYIFIHFSLMCLSSSFGSLASSDGHRMLS